MSYEYHHLPVENNINTFIIIIQLEIVSCLSIEEIASVRVCSGEIESTFIVHGYENSIGPCFNTTKNAYNDILRITTYNSSTADILIASSQPFYVKTLEVFTLGCPKLFYYKYNGTFGFKCQSSDTTKLRSSYTDLAGLTVSTCPPSCAMCSPENFNNCSECTNGFILSKKGSICLPIYYGNFTFLIYLRNI